MVAFGEGELGILIGKNGVQYQFTWDDILWAGRAVVGEAGSLTERIAVLWCMAQRFVQLRGGQGLYPTFRSLLQAYCQPINPKWRREGEFCRIGGKYRDAPECSENRLKRREELANLPWEKIPEETQNMLVNWASGKIDNPIPRACEFAVPYVTKGKQHLQLVWDSEGRPDSRTERSGNAFYLTSIGKRKTIDWDEDYVVIQGNGVISTASSPASLSIETDAQQPNSLTPSQSQTFINQTEERIEALTQGRTNSPAIQGRYFVVGTGSVESIDPSALELVSPDNRSISTPSEKFFDQISSLKLLKNYEVSQAVPVLQISCVDDEGNYFNLNKEIFGKSAIHNLTEDFRSNANDRNRDRALASLMSFLVKSETPSVGGPTTISTGKLTIKVHNMSLVRSDHPQGKFIDLMLRQGLYLRIRYGTESTNDALKPGIQWLEDDFFVSNHELSFQNDNTAEITITLLPAAQNLFNRVLIGENLEVNEQLSLEDQNLAIQAAVSEDSPPEQRAELEQQVSTFVKSFNGALMQNKLRSNKFGSILHGLVSQSEILNSSSANRALIIENYIEAIRTIQSIVLTKKFEDLLRQHAYKYTLKSVPMVAVNLGPLISTLVIPEVEALAVYISQNSRVVGQTTSESRVKNVEDISSRTNVRVVFGNFNSLAGQWADKPISTFPLNIDNLFAHLRERRQVGEFYDTINGFVERIHQVLQEPVNYIPEEDADTAVLEVPLLKFSFFPDPQDDSSWILHFYDAKEKVVRMQQFLRTFNGVSKERKISDREIKEKLLELKIPWIELGEDGSLIRNMSARTSGDDLVLSHLMFQANTRSFNERNLDASQVSPGITRELIHGLKKEFGKSIRTSTLVMPIKVEVDYYILTSALLFTPIFIFVPLRQYSGLYLPYIIFHEVQNGTAHTKLELHVQQSGFLIER